MTEILTPEQPEELDAVQWMLTMPKRIQVDAGLHSFQIARAPKNYNDLTYPQRMQLLRAHTTFALCKTIIMQNKNYDHGLELVPSAATDPFYPKFVAVISQFESTVIS